MGCRAGARWSLAGLGEFDEDALRVGVGKVHAVDQSVEQADTDGGMAHAEHGVSGIAGDVAEDALGLEVVDVHDEIAVEAGGDRADVDG